MIFEWMVENIDKTITIWTVAMIMAIAYLIKTIIDIWRDRK